MSTQEISDAGRAASPRAFWIVVGVGAAVLATTLVVYLLSHPTALSPATFGLIAEGLSSSGFWTAVGVGLLAQIVDGALGMAYGVTSTTFLLSTGVPPAAASASVHIAEIFTTGFSGLSHWKIGNVNPGLFKRLVIPGVIGAVLGAYFVTTIDGDVLKPFIAGYLLLMGAIIIVKAFRSIKVRTEPPTFVAPLGLTGGFVDAVGGGGWGPVVTTSLLSGGQDPRTTIGSVNAAEFFLAIASGVSFALLGGFTHWTTIAGLVIGGLFAAPFAAILVRKLSTRTLMVTVGVLITSLSFYNLTKALL